VNSAEMPMQGKKKISMPSERDLTTMVEALSYCPDSGVIKWRERPINHFKAVRDQKIWNTRFSGKVAGSEHVRPNGLGYRIISVNDTVYFAHRIAWYLHTGAWPRHEIDHINGRGLDNRATNLRLVSRLQNNKNRCVSRSSRSGVIGVYKMKDCDSWLAKITVDNKTIHLGVFKTKEQAAKARKLADKLYGFHENHGRKRD